MYEKQLDKYRDRLFGLIDENRILCTEIPRPEKAIIEEYQKCAVGLTPTVSDILDSMGILGAISASDLRPLQSGVTVVGPVVTLRYVFERKTPTQGFLDQDKVRLADRDAIAVSQPGDIVVYDADGRCVSCQGGLTSNVAKRAGVAATICDGGVRDIEEIRELAYPVWSRYITPITGKHRLEAAEINGPVVINGIQVHPGDLCIADDSGVVFVPQQLIEKVLELVKVANDKEKRVMQAFDDGESLEEILKILPASKW
ncbi:MAG: RraA family protein [Clostridiales bacterium]|jgi:regulator of RNase E activity RraA|nr:RraA family protein [Clostridiales bacterium]